MYSEEDLRQLRELGDELMDDESLRLTEKLIVETVINECKKNGESLEDRVLRYVNEGLPVPH